MSGFSRVYISGAKADPDCIYYNATITSNTLPTSNLVEQKEVPLTFGESRSTLLVSDASRYQLQVRDIVLSGPTKTLPLLIPNIADPTADARETIYSVFVNVFDGTTFCQGVAPIIWSPENPAQPVPTSVPQSESSSYYYCYTYDHWVKLVNAALYTAWLSAGGNVSFGTKAPFLQYDEGTGLFNMNEDCYSCLVPIGGTLPSPYNATNNAPTLAITGASGTGSVVTFTYAAQSSAPYVVGQKIIVDGAGAYNGTYTITTVSTTTITASGAATDAVTTGTITSYATGEYSFVGMNKQLYQLLGNFSIIYNYDNTAWGGGFFYPEVVLDYGLSLNNIITNGSGVGTSIKTYSTNSEYPITNPFTAAAIQPYARLVQNFIGTSGWTPVMSIVVGTTKIPVRNEDVSATFAFGTSNVGIENNSSSNFFKTLIEFPLIAPVANATRQFISYIPQVEVFSSMDDSHVDIHDVDFQFFWRSNKTGQLNPIKIDTGSSAFVRLVFKKK